MVFCMMISRDTLAIRHYCRQGPPEILSQHDILDLYFDIGIAGLDISCEVRARSMTPELVLSGH